MSAAGREEADAGGGSLDAVLARLGRFGLHQRLTLGLCALLYATNSMYNVNYVFAVEDVNYRCVSACAVAESSAPADKQCWAPACAPRAPGALGWGPNGTEAPLEPCTAWEYDIPHSFVAEFGLACQAWKQPLPGTAHCFGSMLGLLFQGQISDRFGRKKAAVFAGVMAALLGLAKSLASSFWCYLALEMLEAAVGDALSPIFMLSVELGPKKYAIIYQMILLNCYTGGLILMSLIAWLVPYWRYFLRVIYAPSLLALLYPLFLDESARWLLGTGRKEEAVKLIQKIAKRNRVEIDKGMLNKLEYVETQKVDDKKLLLKTFKSRIMVQRFLVCCVWWFTITLINYGMMVSAVLVAGDKYVNFALLMMMDVPANVLYWLVLVNSRRKTSLLVSFLVGGLFCVMQPFVPDSYAWAALGLFMCFETLATFSYNVVYMYTSELFPTHSRNSVHALCSSVGRAGSLLAPQTALLMSYWAGLPAILFGVTSLVSGLLVLGMPETARARLPDTLQQAEMLGRPTQDEPNAAALLGLGLADNAS